MNTDFESELTTEVLATSYFMNEAQFKTNLALIDGYDNHDTARLVEVLGDQYVGFTGDELTALGNIPACIVDREFFQNKTYALDGAGDRGDGIRRTEWFNPESLKTNHWLHYWGIKSTSPYKQACVFSTVQPNVTNVSVSPSTATLAQGQVGTLKFTASVTTAGFANKAVIWTVDKTSATDGVKISQEGELVVPADASVDSITVTATSVYKKTVSGTATVTMTGGESPTTPPTSPTTPPTEAPTSPPTGA